MIPITKKSQNHGISLIIKKGSNPKNEKQKLPKNPKTRQNIICNNTGNLFNQF